MTGAELLYLILDYQYCPTRHHSKTAQNFIKKNLQALETLQETREGRNKIFIHPGGIYERTWGGIILLTILYNCVALPLRIVFLEGYSDSMLATIFLGIDYFIDVLYVLDMVLRAYVLGFFDRNDVVMIRKKIFAHYVRAVYMAWVGRQCTHRARGSY